MAMSPPRGHRLLLFYMGISSACCGLFCTFLRILFLCNLLHVKPFTCTVNRPNRNRQFEGHLLRRLPIVKQIDDFKIVRPPPVNHFFASWHFLHSTSTMSDPIGDFLRRIKIERTIFQHFPHWICMTFPVRSTSSQTLSINLSTRAPLAVDDCASAGDWLPEEPTWVFMARAARHTQVC